MNDELKGAPLHGQSVTLRPHDVCVGLQLLQTPDATFRELAEQVGLSLGETHNAAKRLQVARLLMPHRRVVNARAFVEFLVHGVPYVFAGELGGETQGVPTAFSGPALEGEFASGVHVVWPSAEGEARGAALAPLCKHAPRLAKLNPTVYRWLTAVDALRIGRIRERRSAQSYLESELLAESSEV